jgi:hypothetical protein
MSLPSFPEDSSSPVLVDFPMRGGTGDHLPVWLLACCGAFTAVGECEHCIPFRARRYSESCVCILLRHAWRKAEMGRRDADSDSAATGVSIMSITLQLKNYRKPPLQRAVVRIMLM